MTKFRAKSQSQEGPLMREEPPDWAYSHALYLKSLDLAQNPGKFPDIHTDHPYTWLPLSLNLEV